MTKIYLDSCVAIYFVEGTPEVRNQVHEQLDAIENARVHTSPLVHLECFVAPFKNDDEELLQRYKCYFVTTLKLPLTNAVYERAAKIRADYRLLTPDALHLACAEMGECLELWTADLRFATIGYTGPVRVRNIMK